MFAFGVTVLAACLVVHATSRPYELLIYRQGHNQGCSLATLKKAQEHRGSSTYGYTGAKSLESGEERLRYVLQARRDAWSHLETSCGPQDSWDFPVLTDTTPLPLTSDKLRLYISSTAQQDVLTLPEPTRGLFPLEFELESLVKSGHSSNRVDLIFFADGCACYSLCIELVFQRQVDCYLHQRRYEG